MKCFNVKFLSRQVIFSMFILGMHANVSMAQSGMPHIGSQESIMEGNIFERPPGKFKALKKKNLKNHQPYTGYTHAVGYSCKDGSKIFYYQTDSTWNHLDRGIKIWGIAFQIAKDLGQYKFLQSGFYNNTPGKSSNTYFLNISIQNEAGKYAARLTFSEHEGKLLYGLHLVPETGGKKSVDPSKNIVKNQDVAKY